MKMSPQQKENVNITWKALALVLFGYAGYEFREIKLEIRQSSDFRIEQRGINQDVEKMLIELKNYHKESDAEIRELKTYYWESVGRDRNN